MQLKNRQQQQIPYPPILIKMLTYSPLKIILFLSASIGLCFLASLISMDISFFVALVIMFLVLYLHLINSPLFLFFYTIQQTNSPSINKFAIYDFSSNTNEESSRLKGGVFIVNSHHLMDGVKYFFFKGQLYKIEGDQTLFVNEVDTLKILDIQNIATYKRDGLDDDKMKISLDVFGVEKQYTTVSMANFIIKRLNEQKQWAILLTFMQLSSAIVFKSVFSFLVLLAINITILILNGYVERKKYEFFRNKYDQFFEGQIHVIRKSQEKSIKLRQILVGDIIKITKQKFKDQYYVYFKSLISSDLDIIIKQGPNRKESMKSPIERTENLKTNRRKYIIKPFSIIDKHSLKGEELLIVLDNRSISRLFANWFQRSTQEEFKSNNYAIKWSAFRMYVLTIIFLVMIKIIIGLFTGRSFNQAIIEAINFIFLLIPSLIYVLFSINEIKGYKQLLRQDINVLTSEMSRAGNISNMLISIAEIGQLQLRQILYKNLIFDPSNKPFIPDRVTLTNGSTYQSLLAIILYISMGYFDQQEEKNTFLKQIYNKFKSQFEYTDGQGDFKDIQHKGAKKFWKLIKKDLQVEQGYRSWRIQFNNNTNYVITESSYGGQSNFRRLIGKEDSTRMDSYIGLASTLLEEGKQLKMVTFRNYRQRENLRIATQLHNDYTQTSIFGQMKREGLQKNMEFGCFIVFDIALKQSCLNTIKELRDFQLSGNKIFRMNFFTSNQNRNIAGFQHQLTNVPFYYDYQNEQKVSLVRQKMKQNGTLVLGNEHSDIAGCIISDLSIQIQHAHEIRQNIMFPADISICNIGQIKNVLQIGRWMLECQMQIIKTIFLILFAYLCGLVFLGFQYPHNSYDNFSYWIALSIIFFVIIPQTLKQIFIYQQTLQRYKKFNRIFTINFITQIFISVIVIILLIIVADIDGVCTAQINNPGQSHMISFRYHLSAQSQKGTCMNLPVLLGGTIAVFVFALFYSEEIQSLQKFEFKRLLLVVVWLLVLILVGISFKIILIGLGILLFLALIKLFIKIIGPTHLISEKRYPPELQNDGNMGHQIYNKQDIDRQNNQQQ